jgi:hypothetical protein
MQRAYRLLSGIGLFAIVASAIFLAGAVLIPNERHGLLLGAFISLIIVVSCMEIRVRLGYRLKRGRLFLLHMLTAPPGFILLGASVLYSLPSLTFPILLLLLVGALSTGSILFLQGWQLHGSTSSSPDSRA